MDVLDEFLDPDDHRYIKLARILEKQNGHPYSLTEAKKIGRDLIELYKVLARGRKLVKSKPEKTETSDG